MLHQSVQKRQTIDLPVISIGNAVVGGAGKTPVAIAICNILKMHRFNPYILTRGYKNQNKDIYPVYANHNPDVKLIGDEAFLLSKDFNVLVDPNRLRAATVAQRQGADIIILDDGHQNMQLEKNISFLVVDAIQGFGNSWPMPAGPLREPKCYSLKKADAIISIGKYENKEKPVFQMKRVHSCNLQQREVVAFAGIGFPKKFEASLNECGFIVDDFITFPDHHNYSEKEINDLLKNSPHPLITTRKDFVRIPQKFQKHIAVLDMKLVFEEPLKIWYFIERGISNG